MAVEHQLACGGTCGSHAQAVNDVVEAALEQLQEDLTGDTLHRRSLLEEVAELFFEYAVSVLGFLLLAELYAVLRGFAATVLTVLAGGEVALLKHFVGAEYGLAELAGDFGFGACVSCHFFVWFVTRALCLRPASPVAVQPRP